MRYLRPHGHDLQALAAFASALPCYSESTSVTTRRVIVAAAIAAAVVVIVVEIFVRAGAEPKTLPMTTRARAPTNSLVLIDSNNRVAAAVPLSGVPTRVAYGAGAFWVAVPSKGFVARVDARTYAVRRLHVGEDPYDVAFGAGAVWVPDHDLGLVFRLDPSTGTTRRTDSFHEPTVATGYGLGAAWAIVAPGDLKRIDPRTLAVTRTTSGVSYASEGLEPKILFGDDQLIVETPTTSLLTRVDRTGKVEKSQHVPDLTSATAVGDAIWITDSTSVVRLDGSSKTRVGTRPADVAATRDSLWVAVYDDAVVKRVGTDGKLRGSVQLARTPVAVAAGDGMVGVAVTGSPVTR